VLYDAAVFEMVTHLLYFWSEIVELLMNIKERKKSKVKRENNNIVVVCLFVCQVL